MYELLMKHINSNVNRTFLFYKGEKITYGELDTLIHANIASLYKFGIQPGDVVVLEYKDKIKWVVFLLSLLAMKCQVVLLPEDLTDYQKKAILNKITQKKYLKDDYYCENLKEVDIDKNILIDALQKAISCKAGVYHCSSGSVANPKLIFRKTSALIYEGKSFQKTLNLKCEDKLLSLAPLTHSYAFGATLMSTIVTGCSLYLIDEFQPRYSVSMIENHKITMLVLVPIMVRVLSQIGQKKKYDFSSLRFAIVGAGKVDEIMNQAFYKAYKKNLMMNYGSTETGGLISNTSFNHYDSIGQAMWGVELKLKKDELWVKTPALMDGYYGQSITLDSEGFYGMGDICKQDNEGYYYIKGRKQNIIKVGGNSVNPAEVESVINMIGDVNECVVFGSINKKGEEQVNALVHASKIISDLYIKQFCLKRLERYKCPKVIKLCDCIPKNSIGKINLQMIKKNFEKNNN